MEKIIEMLPDAWSIDITCYGSDGFCFCLYRSGIVVLTVFDLETFIKESLTILTKYHTENS